MLLALALVIGIAWLLGFTVFHVTAGAIHVLLVIAVVVAIRDRGHRGDRARRAGPPRAAVTTAGRAG
jgi:hypothetical protein